MKAYRLLPAASLALFAGCSGDSVSNLVKPDAHAAVRWINAVPDTMPMDYRVVDIVTNASEAGVSYRGTSGMYRPIPPGAHRIRVFPAGATTTGAPTAACNSDAVVSKVLLDTTFTFVANHYYTVVHAGYMKAGAAPAHRLVITDDVFPTVAAGTIAVRFGNAMGNTPSADFYAAGGTTATGGVTAPAVASGVAFGAFSAYSALPVRDTLPAGNSYRASSTAAGSTTVLANTLLQIGTPAFPGSLTVPPLDPVGGTQQAGSVMTVIGTPPAVAYSLTSSGSSPSCPPVGTITTVAGTTTSANVVLVDKNPKDAVLGQ